MYYKNIYCPECGCEDVTLYDDGSCECNGCGYVWQEETDCRKVKRSGGGFKQAFIDHADPYRDKNKYYTYDFNKGMIIAVALEIVGAICACIGIVKWVYGLFAYSIFIEKDRIASATNSDQATTFFWVGIVIIFVAGVAFHLSKPSS